MQAAPGCLTLLSSSMLPPVPCLRLLLLPPQDCTAYLPGLQYDAANRAQREAAARDARWLARLARPTRVAHRCVGDLCWT